MWDLEGCGYIPEAPKIVCVGFFVVVHKWYEPNDSAASVLLLQVSSMLVLTYLKLFEVLYSVLYYESAIFSFDITLLRDF